MDPWFGETEDGASESACGASYAENKSEVYSDGACRGPTAKRHRQEDLFRPLEATISDNNSTAAGNITFTAPNQGMFNAPIPLLLTNADNNTTQVGPQRKRQREENVSYPSPSPGNPDWANRAIIPQAAGTGLQSVFASASSPQCREPVSIMPGQTGHTGQTSQHMSILNTRSAAPPGHPYDPFMSSYLYGTGQLAAAQAPNFTMPEMNQSGGGGGLELSGMQLTNMLGRQQGPNAFPGISPMLQNAFAVPLQGNTFQQRVDISPSCFNMSNSIHEAGTGVSKHLYTASQDHHFQQDSHGTKSVEAARSVNAHPTQVRDAIPTTQPVTLPPVDEGQVAHYSERAYVPLGIDEDPNWLSEFHCFVRGELIEVFRASHQDVSARYASKRVAYLQVGIRCRFCAHLPPGTRITRSSAFPSSVRQIYQSLTMIIRDHFPNCSEIPADMKSEFVKLKNKTSQGASDSKRYWSYSALKRGMVDSEDGIIVNEKTIAAGERELPYGTTPGQLDTGSSWVVLVSPDDHKLASGFLFTLLSQAYVVQLKPSERMGNRKSLRVGLPGFGCRYCCQAGRLGLCRMFPARRRTLYAKTMDLYDHLKRCVLCPSDIKDRLGRLEKETRESDSAEQEKEFFDRIWARLGHGSSQDRAY